MEATQMDQIFKDIVETIREPLLILDQDLRVILASRSFYEFFKVTPEATVGQLVYDLGNKQWDIPNLRELLEIILPEKTSFDNYEVEHDFTTIGRRTMLLNARQIKQAMGKERIILLAIEDITERKQLEDLLADSEERFRRLFETANDGILLLEKHEGKIAQANPAMTSMLGYSNIEFFGKNLKDVGFPDNMGAIRELLQALEKNGIIHYNGMPIQKKTGQFVDTDIYMVDKASLVQCNIRDITESKKSRATLQRIEWMLSGKKVKDDDLSPEYGDLIELNQNGLILSSVGKDQLTMIASDYLDLMETSSAIYEINGDYALGLFSSSYCRMMDTASRKLCKTNDNQQALNCGKWLCHESCWGTSLQAINTGKPADVECSGGINLYAVPIRSAGKIVGAINYGYGDPPEDDDKLKELAEVYQIPVAELREKAQEYQTRPQYIIDYAKKRIQSSAQQLGNIIEREKVQAQYLQAQKMESVGRLAGGVAHDFNNMLTIILSYSQMAMKTEDLPESIHHDLQQIYNAAQKSAEITQQLLAFARKQTINPRVLDFNKTLEQMLKMLRRLMGEEIDLVWLPGSDLWPVLADPSQMDQILANLCVNARDAIGGTGKVTMETGNVTFDKDYCASHSGFTPGDFVFLSVSDTGCGMDRETQENIFEPFFTTKSTEQGTGLGLSTVYGIIKQNHGFINVYSEPEKGTTFRIYLPRHKGKTGLPEQRETEAIPVGGNETILIVEDEPAILELCKNILGRLGYTILAALTPNRAISLAEEYSGRIHLLLTDVVMPEMNGRDLATRVQTLRPDIRVLFMSGYSTNVVSDQKILEKGAAYIQKPFNPGDLASKLREILDHPAD